MQPVSSEVTELLDRWSGGDPQALDELVPLIFDDVRELARRHLAREAPGHTLQPTALVNEAWLRLVGGVEQGWKSRAHFFGAASRAIRRVLVDHARARRRAKRGGDALKVTLSTQLAGDEVLALDFVALDDALERLGEEYPEERETVELRFFGGLSSPEIAEVMAVSSRTVARRWTFARAWLFRQLREGAEEATAGGS
jgi:RNA polymerase sigma factor (TIGR02999 family)